MNSIPHFVSWKPQIFIHINNPPNQVHNFSLPVPCDFSYKTTFLNNSNQINYSNGSFQTAAFLNTPKSPGIHRLNFDDLFTRQLCLSQNNIIHTANVSTFMMNHDKTATDVYAYKSEAIHIICILVGWLYFFAWSVSFYPQVILNFKRKSTSGLNIDFVLLNIYGFLCYSIYNCSLYYNKKVQSEYFKQNPDSLPPVETNDVFFSIHALLLSTLTLSQIIFYNGVKSIKPSKPALIFFLLTFSFIFVQIFGLLNSKNSSIINVLNQISLIKVLVTLIKYMPQAYQNYKRKSTTGWSIHNILLDISGGSLSLLQLFLEAWNFNVWTNSNPTKLALGFISILFDILFILQHYVFYKRRTNDEERYDNENQPLISD